MSYVSVQEPPEARVMPSTIALYQVPSPESLGHVTGADVTAWRNRFFGLGRTSMIPFNQRKYGTVMGYGAAISPIALQAKSMLCGAAKTPDAWITCAAGSARVASDVRYKFWNLVSKTLRDSGISAVGMAPQTQVVKAASILGKRAKLTLIGQPIWQSVMPFLVAASQSAMSGFGSALGDATGPCAQYPGYTWNDMLQTCVPDVTGASGTPDSTPCAAGTSRDPVTGWCLPNGTDPTKCAPGTYYDAGKGQCSFYDATACPQGLSPDAAGISCWPGGPPQPAVGGQCPAGYQKDPVTGQVCIADLTPNPYLPPQPTPGTTPPGPGPGPGPTPHPTPGPAPVKASLFRQPLFWGAVAIIAVGGLLYYREESQAAA